MTDEEIAKARAEYDALPGTPPNGFSFRSESEIAGRPYTEVVRDLVKLHPEGKHFRATAVDGGLWLESWDEPPFKEADFNPPYTLTAPDAQA